MPDNGALERLSKKLNSKDTGDETQRARLFPKAQPAPGAWHEDAAPVETNIFMARKPRFNVFRIVFIGSAAFFVLALAVAAYLFFSGQNTVSTKNVDVQVAGPTQIRAGDTLSLQIIVTNHNTVPMQLTDLVVEFPPGTRSDTDVSVSLPRIRESIGTINPGESINRTVNAVLFGASGAVETVQASAEYRVPSSNAVFVSDTTYTTRISESPAAIAVAAPAQVVSGQSSTIAATVTSNSPQVLSNMLLIATYPPGFSFTSATPAPAFGTTVWKLGDIEPAGTRTITINGVFTGEDGDQRVITFTSGNQNASSSQSVAAPLATGEADFTVTKPFISTDVALNGSVADVHTIQRGATVQGTIDWTNNLPVAVQSLAITLSLKGQIIDQGTVHPVQGFYSSANSTITWDSSTLPALANVAPGASGTLTFSFATLPLSRGTFRSPTVNFSVNVSANRQSEGNVPGTVTATASTQAMVATNLALGASLASVSGPVPPKVNTETVYTVTLNLTNSANDIANAVVTGILPTYVRFIGNPTPSSENVTYDSQQGTVSWSPGSLNAGSSRTVSFQVGVTPSVSQVAQVPVVMRDIHATAYDRFVQDTVSADAPVVDTDSGSSLAGRGVVVP